MLVGRFELSKSIVTPISFELGMIVVSYFLTRSPRRQTRLDCIKLLPFGQTVKITAESSSFSKLVKAFSMCCSAFLLFSNVNHQTIKTVEQNDVTSIPVLDQKLKYLRVSDFHSVLDLLGSRSQNETLHGASFAQNSKTKTSFSFEVAS